MIRSLALLVALMSCFAAPRMVAAQDEDPPPVLAQRATVGDVLREGPVHEAFAKAVPERPEVPPPADKAPPDAIEEIQPEIDPELAKKAVWIPGYWSWDEEGKEFHWITGVWRFPPPGHRWVPGRWVDTDEGPRRKEGFWLTRGVREVPRVPRPQYPADKVVIQPAPPGHFWVRGGLVYVDGEYQWREGFAAREVENLVWTPAQYIWTERGWIFVDGYWDHPLKGRGQAFAALDFENEDYAQPDFHLQAAYPVPLDSITEGETGWTYRLNEDVEPLEKLTVSFVAPAGDLIVPQAPVAVVAAAGTAAVAAVPRKAVVRGVARRGRLTVEGIAVRLEGSSVPPTETDASGRFEFRDVPYDEYMILAEGPVQNITRQATAVIQVDKPVVDKVTLELE